jgi:hypothetical protein
MVAGAGVAPQGAHGINFTSTPASGKPFASSTTTPLAFVYAIPGAVDDVGTAVGVLVGGVPPPPPPHAVNTAIIPIAPATIRTLITNGGTHLAVAED